jgi:hypothetical protein
VQTSVKLEQIKDERKGWNKETIRYLIIRYLNMKIPDKRVAEDDASMISTIQTLVLLLGVVAAVAVLAARLEVPAAILLVTICLRH